MKNNNFKETADPDVVLEEKHDGYARYRRFSDGRRWEVYGYCDRRGDCLIGAIIDTPDGVVEIKDHEHLEQLKTQLGKERIDSEMDVPVTPEFNICCGADLFRYVELDSVP